jgi:hypothetical protein
MSCSRSLRFVLRSLMSLIAAGYLLAQLGGSPAVAALTQQQVNQFLNNPSAILTANPQGGGKLIGAIRDLMLADPTALKTVIGLLANANAAQQQAIGMGLGQAAKVLAPTNPAAAAEIQTAVAASGLKLAVEAYQTEVGDLPIGAGGGGGEVGGAENAGLALSATTGGGGGGGGANAPGGGGGSTGGTLTAGGAGGSLGGTTSSVVSPGAPGTIR